MDKIEQQEKLKAILEANINLREDVKRWSISYNKNADMLIAGANFPVGSYYFNIDEGVMLRVDKSNKVYGFAIENTKSFMGNNPQFALPLSVVVHPWKFWCLSLPSLIVQKNLSKSLVKIKALLSVSDYIAGKAVFA